MTWDCHCALFEFWYVHVILLLPFVNYTIINSGIFQDNKGPDLLTSWMLEPRFLTTSKALSKSNFFKCSRHSLISIAVDSRDASPIPLSSKLIWFALFSIISRYTWLNEFGRRLIFEEFFTGSIGVTRQRINNKHFGTLLTVVIVQYVLNDILEVSLQLYNPLWVFFYECLGMSSQFSRHFRFVTLSFMYLVLEDEDIIYRELEWFPRMIWISRTKTQGQQRQL